MRLHGDHTKSGRPRTFPFGSLPALAGLLQERRELTRALEREHQRIIPYVLVAERRVRWQHPQRVGDRREGGWTAGAGAARPAALGGAEPDRAGVSGGVVMKLCGWSTRSMLARYDIAATQDLDDAAAKLGAFLASKPARQAVKS